MGLLEVDLKDIVFLVVVVILVGPVASLFLVEFVVGIREAWHERRTQKERTLGIEKKIWRGNS